MENTKFLHFLESSMTHFESELLLRTLRGIWLGDLSHNIINIYGAPETGKSILAESLLRTFPDVFKRVNPYSPPPKPESIGEAIVIDDYDISTHPQKNILDLALLLGYNVIVVSIEPIKVPANLSVEMKPTVSIARELMDEDKDIRLTILG